MNKKNVLKMLIMLMVLVGALKVYISCTSMDTIATDSYNNGISSPQPSNGNGGGYYVGYGSYALYYTYSPRPTNTPIPTPTNTSTNTPTNTPANTPTNTPTNIPSKTPANTLSTPPSTQPQRTSPTPTKNTNTTSNTPVTSPGNSPAGHTDLPVITPIVTKIPGNINYELIYKSILESKSDKLSELIRSVSKKWKINSISKVSVDLDMGELSFKAAFKYKNLWKTSRVNSYMYFDTLVSDDFTKFGIRFSEISRIKSSNPILDISDVLTDFGKKMNDSMKGTIFWYKDQVPSTYKTLIQSQEKD